MLLVFIFTGRNYKILIFINQDEHKGKYYEPLRCRYGAYWFIPSTATNTNETKLLEHFQFDYTKSLKKTHLFVRVLEVFFCNYGKK